MNIYDKKVIKCSNCAKSIGEVDYDAQIIFPRCGDCADPIPAGDDILYLRSRSFKPKKTSKLVNTIPS